MIDISQLTSLVSAFRVETEKESISPETVGKLLQDILDLLATASTGQELQVLDDWKHRASRTQSIARLNSAEVKPMLREAKTMLSQYVVVYDVEDANITDPQILYLKIKGLSLRNGSKYTSSVPIAGATDSKAGAMSASSHQEHRGADIGDVKHFLAAALRFFSLTFFSPSSLYFFLRISPVEGSTA